MQIKKISYNFLIMLFFKVYSIMNVELFNKTLELSLKDKSLFKPYKITITSQETCFNKFLIDNKKFENNEYYFTQLKEIVNNYYVLNSEFLKKQINFNSYLFFKMSRQQDITYYNFYVLGSKGKLDLQKIIEFTNFKYKFNFNSKERKLVYKLKNNFLKGNKYSYNFFYMLDIQESIETLEIEIKELIEQKETYFKELETLDIEIKGLNDLGYKTKNLKFKLNIANTLKSVKLEYYNIQDLIIKVLDEIKTKEQHLQELKTLESELTSSTFKETTLNDYFTDFKYEE